MIDIKVTLQGYDKDSSISEFVGNDNNEFNDCRFWINKDIKKLAINEIINIEDIKRNDVLRKLE